MAQRRGGCTGANCPREISARQRREPAAGYLPEIDATIVTRTLDAGATIVGKAVCEDLCFSGASHTAATGPVLNHRTPGRSAGGLDPRQPSVVPTETYSARLDGDISDLRSLPVGMMVIGRHIADATVLRVAAAAEQVVGAR